MERRACVCVYVCVFECVWVPAGITSNPGGQQPAAGHRCYILQAHHTQAVFSQPVMGGGGGGGGVVGAGGEGGKSDRERAACLGTLK